MTCLLPILKCDIECITAQLNSLQNVPVKSLDCPFGVRVVSYIYHGCQISFDMCELILNNNVAVYIREFSQQNAPSAEKE